MYAQERLRGLKGHYSVHGRPLLPFGIIRASGGLLTAICSRSGSRRLGAGQVMRAETTPPLLIRLRDPRLRHMRKGPAPGRRAVGEGPVRVNSVC
jgi:hypothetical protein